jgi:hypothetical protein
VGQGGHEGQADGQEVNFHLVDSGGSGEVHQDGDAHLYDQKGLIGHVDDGNHQGDGGEGGVGCGDRVGMVKNQKRLA